MMLIHGLPAFARICCNVAAELKVPIAPFLCCLQLDWYEQEIENLNGPYQAHPSPRRSGLNISSWSRDSRKSDIGSMYHVCCSDSNATCYGRCRSIKHLVCTVVEGVRYRLSPIYARTEYIELLFVSEQLIASSIWMLRRCVRKDIVETDEVPWSQEKYREVRDVLLINQMTRNVYHRASIQQQKYLIFLTCTNALQLLSCFQCGAIGRNRSRKLNFKKIQMEEVFILIFQAALTERLPSGWLHAKCYVHESRVRLERVEKLLEVKDLARYDEAPPVRLLLQDEHFRSIT